MNKQIKAGADIHAGDGGYGEGTQEGYDAFVKVRNKSLAQGRIRELAVEADEYAEQTVHYYQGQFDGLTWEGKIKQTRDTKFAELIVQECLSQVDKIRDGLEADSEDQQALGADWAGLAIARHFGVE